jgi:plasmid stability protein
MEEEAREILRNAARAENQPARGLGTEIAALFAAVGADDDIRELRGRKIRPPSFHR